MLKAYFDDSGTSDQSDAVLWAGLIGHTDQWEQFRDGWKAALAKPRLDRVVSHYHGIDAAYGTGQFRDWKRAAIDTLVFDLRKVILDAGLHGFAACTFKQMWGEIIEPPLDTILKGPEDFCFSDCLSWARDWSTANASGAEVLPIFNTDRQADKIREAWRIQQNMHGGLLEILFEDAKPNPEIQAADLIAGLTLNDLVNWRKDGWGRRMDAHLKPFVDSGRFSAVLNDEDVLLKRVRGFQIVEVVDLPGWLPSV